MADTHYQERRRLESLDADHLAQLQLDRINHLLGEILPHNRFYAEKLADCRLPLEALDQLADLPYTFKDELLGGRGGAKAHSGDIAANLTYPFSRYVRFHRTSGTRGRPLAVLDTADDWQWWCRTWQYVLDAADVQPDDRALLAFSFGPFIGFWSAYEALAARGALVIPSGGLSTAGRLDLIDVSEATVLLCTPTYALHLVEVAIEHGIDVAETKIKKIIVAGEPGGNVPAIRQRIESAWGARLIDHSGATEVGPWGYGDDGGIRVIESEFIAEFLSVETGETGGEGELCELVLTSLGRFGAPVIRYRTGDLVRPTWNAPGENRFVLLEGGVLGRADDMLVIRGVNIFPSAIEQILRSFPEVVEYRMTAIKQGEMDAIQIEIEDRLAQPRRVADELRLRLGLKVEVTLAEVGSLPRSEGKGTRFVDLR